MGCEEGSLSPQPHASEMVHQGNAPCHQKTHDLSSIPGFQGRWGKERTNAWKLTSDLHICFIALYTQIINACMHVCLQSHMPLCVIINNIFFNLPFSDLSGFVRAPLLPLPHCLQSSRRALRTMPWHSLCPQSSCS